MVSSCKEIAPKLLLIFSILVVLTTPVTAGIFGYRRPGSEQAGDSLDELHRLNAGYPSRALVTVYATHITTMTRVFIIHHAPCAKLVNVTGECRIRRGRRVEDPVVLTFDDETERMVDVLYTPVLNQSTTRKPEDVYSDDSSHIEHPVPEKPAISPSFEEYSSENLGSSDRSSRFYFSHVVDAFHPLGRSRTPSITKTITHYSTVFTSTKKTSRNTFFVQGCTPLYFPFHICGKN